MNQYIKRQNINAEKYFLKISNIYFRIEVYLPGIISAILLSTLSSHLMRDLGHHLNTTNTIAISYMIYYTVFGLLYCHDNKKEYLLENGKLDTKKFGKNILKVIFSVCIAEVVYVLTRWSIHFYLLTSGHEHYLTSIIAHVSSAIMFVIMINLSVKITKLFNNRYDHKDNKPNSECKRVS